MLRAIVCLAALVAVFYAGTSAALLAWGIIKLPFSNPWHIMGAPQLLHFNPGTNRFRYLCLLAAPICLLMMVYLISRLKELQSLRRLLFENRKRTEESAASPWRVVTAGCVLLLMVVVGLTCTGDGGTWRFDSFHEGECLGPATAYLHGAAPYKHFLLHHGFFQDCGRAVLAFKLFGHSIAAVRTLWSIVKLVNFALIGVVLLLLFRGRTVGALAAGTVFCALCIVRVPFPEGTLQAVVFVTGREFTALAFLIAMIAAQRMLRTESVAPWKTGIAAFVPAFVAIGAFGFSVDRATYVTASYALLWPVLYIADLRQAEWRTRAAFTLGSATGVVFGAVLVGAVIQWNLIEFARFVFHVLPGAFPMIDTVEYPIGDWQWLAGMLLVSFGTYWVTHKALSAPGFGSFVRDYFEDMALAVVAAFTFLGALGISDWTHVSQHITPACLLALWILSGRGGDAIRSRTVRIARGGLVGLAAAVVFWWAVTTVFSEGMLRVNFPVGVPDSAYVSKSQRETVGFIRSRLRPGESFYTMTSEGHWYYLLDQPCPTRFAMTYVGATDFYQREAVRDLKRHNVTYILYRNSCFSNSILGIPTLMRLPILTGYVKREYEPYRKIGDNEIWRLKRLRGKDRPPY